MPITHVQDASNSASATSVAVTLSATVAGNALIAPGRLFSNAAAGYPSSISGGGTWTFPTADNNGSPPAFSFGGTGSTAWITWTLGASSVTSVTFTESGATGPYIEPSVGEFSGVASAGPGGNATGSASSAALPALTYSAGDLVVALAYPSNGINWSGTPSNGTSSFTAYAAASAADNVNWAVWRVMQAGDGPLSGFVWPGTGVPTWISVAQVFHPPASVQQAIPQDQSTAAGGDVYAHVWSRGWLRRTKVK